MRIKKALLYLSVFMFSSSISFAVQAADKQDTIAMNTNTKLQSKVPAKAPISIEADNLSFSDLTGDVFAEGNVVIKQNSDRILTDAMRGNSKKTDVWIDGKATLQQVGTELVGTGTHYNYTTHLGNMHDASGIVGKERIAGKNMEFFPGELVAHDATMTRCPAKVPDYHISAEKIEIWPGEKMIAYNAKFWLGKTVIYSMSKYETSLKKGAEGQNAFPRINYSSGNGFSISQYLEYPLADRFAAFADLNYYSKQGFEPTYGFVSRQKDYTIKLYQGKQHNGDDEWIKKEPELSVSMAPIRLGHVVADLSATGGKWSEGAISGSRQDYRAYFNRDPIQFGRIYTLSVGTGFEKINYGYNKSSNNIWNINTTLAAKVNERLDTWVGYYYYHQTGASPYQYDKIDTARQFSSGFMYKVDKKNSVGMRMDYDVALSKVKDVDYIWHRNLHCFEADITYRAKRQSWNFSVSTVKW